MLTIFLSLQVCHPDLPLMHALRCTIQGSIINITHPASFFHCTFNCDSSCTLLVHPLFSPKFPKPTWTPKTSSSPGFPATPLLETTNCWSRISNRSSNMTELFLEPMEGCTRGCFLLRVSWSRHLFVRLSHFNLSKIWNRQADLKNQGGFPLRSVSFSSTILSMNLSLAKAVLLSLELVPWYVSI
jgi:hypothetical protein